MKSLEDKIKNDTIVVSNAASKEIIDYLYTLSDEMVLTFYRCSMSILAGRMMEEDEIEINMEKTDEWIGYHRKVIGFTLESMDIE